MTDVAEQTRHGLAEKWLLRIKGHEGGYWDDPVGGPTKWGISKRAYPKLDIKSLTVEQAADIYKRDYLAPLKWEKYSDGVAYQLMDFGVNSGPKTAIKRLQREVATKDDGSIGPATIERINAMSESDLIMLVLASRLELMAGCKNLLENCKGWMLRIAKNLRYGAEDSE